MAATRPDPEHPPAPRPPEAAGTRSIGQVLAELRPEFPDVTVSKIRFLESEGLLAPARTAAGYRRYSAADVDRLRFVLLAQRDRYLPLRVIKAELGARPPGTPAPSAVSRPPAAGGGADASGESAPAAGERTTAGDAAVATGFFRRPRPATRHAAAEVAAAAGAAGDRLAELIGFRLLRPDEDGSFDGDGLAAARLVGELARFGFEPRHLRAAVAAADRDAGMVEQAMAPMAHRRGGQARLQAAETTAEVAGLWMQLHAVLLRARLPRPD